MTINDTAKNSSIMTKFHRLLFHFFFSNQIHLANQAVQISILDLRVVV